MSKKKEIYTSSSLTKVSTKATTQDPPKLPPPPPPPLKSGDVAPNFVFNPSLGIDLFSQKGKAVLVLFCSRGQCGMPGDLYLSLASGKNIKPIVLDTQKNPEFVNIHKLYGVTKNWVMVVDSNGIIVFSGDWNTSKNGVTKVLEELG